LSEPVVGILVGSESDRERMQGALDELDKRGIVYEFDVRSAHREPDAVAEYCRSARERGLKVLICGAGLSAALPGVADHSQVAGRGRGLPALGLHHQEGVQRVESRLAVVRQDGQFQHGGLVPVVRGPSQSLLDGVPDDGQESVLGREGARSSLDVEQCEGVDTGVDVAPVRLEAAHVGVHGLQEEPAGVGLVAGLAGFRPLALVDPAEQAAGLGVRALLGLQSSEDGHGDVAIGRRSGPIRTSVVGERCLLRMCTWTRTSSGMASYTAIIPGQSSRDRWARKSSDSTPGSVVPAADTFARISTSSADSAGRRSSLRAPT